MPVFRCVLPRFCNHKYEFWELLNEVWLQGKVQKLSDIRLAYKVIESGCIDYMRVQEGRIVKGRRHGKKRLRFQSSDRQIVDSQRPVTLAQTIADKGRPVGESAHWREELQALSSGCTRTERLMLSMTSEGFTLDEIGRAAGYAQSRMSQLRTQYRKTLSDRMGRYYSDDNE